MKVYVERTVSQPLRSDEVRDQARVGEVVYGDPFWVLDLTEEAPMTLAAAETFGTHFLREADPPEETPPGELTVRFRDPEDAVLDLLVKQFRPPDAEVRGLSDPPPPTGYRRDSELTGWPIDSETGEELRPG